MMCLFFLRWQILRQRPHTNARRQFPAVEFRLGAFFSPPG